MCARACLATNRCFGLLISSLQLRTLTQQHVVACLPKFGCLGGFFVPHLSLTYTYQKNCRCGRLYLGLFPRLYLRLYLGLFCAFGVPPDFVFQPYVLHRMGPNAACLRMWCCRSTSYCRRYRTNHLPTHPIINKRCRCSVSAAELQLQDMFNTCERELCCDVQDDTGGLGSGG